MKSKTQRIHSALKSNFFTRKSVLHGQKIGSTRFVALRIKSKALTGMEKFFRVVKKDLLAQ
jgi:hypothetical protein